MRWPSLVSSAWRNALRRPIQVRRRTGTRLLTFFPTQLTTPVQPSSPIPETPARIARIARWCVALLLTCAATAYNAEIAKEYQIKAAFVYNFTKFVEWPSDQFGAPTEPIIIGILGKNPFGDSLEVAVRGRKVGGRDIVIIHVAPASRGTAVHVLFVPEGEEVAFDPQLAPGALTVGETERFNSRGGMITFISDAEKVRFMINLEHAERAELKLSAQLLKLASTVRRKS